MVEPDKEIYLSLDEYANLIQRDQWLTCLEAAGVDNWDGYEYALEMYEAEDY